MSDEAAPAGTDLTPGVVEPDRPPARRPRRAHAAPTNPQADQADDLPAQRQARPERQGALSADEARRDPRDAWILDQRPPHWD